MHLHHYEGDEAQLHYYNQVVLSPDPTYLQTKSYSAQSDRKWWADVVSPGVQNNATNFVITLLGGMNLRFAGGVAWILGRNVADQGMYRQYVAGTTDIAVPASHASLPRLDQAILRVMDNTHDGSGFNECRLEIVPGTATSGATLDNRLGAANLDALTGASRNYLLLYDILVPAAASSLVTGNLRRRVWQALPGWGVMPSRPPWIDVTTFQNLRDMPDGYEVIVLVDGSINLNWSFRYNATGSTYKWQFIGGEELRSFVNGGVSVQSTGWIATGASLAAPMPGEYDIDYTAHAAHSSGSPGGAVYASMFVGGGGPNWATYEYNPQTLGAANVGARIRYAVPSGQVWDIRGSQQGSGAGGSVLNFPTISMCPYRVSTLFQ
jgi:hypothetical protein